LPAGCVSLAVGLALLGGADGFTRVMRGAMMRRGGAVSMMTGGSDKVRSWLMMTEVAISYFALEYLILPLAVLGRGRDCAAASVCCCCRWR
jgi:hypothetical protein